MTHGSILLVDDEPKIRGALAAALRDESHDVTATGSPREALRLLNERPFDLLVVDNLMPEMTGLELIREVTTMPAGERPEILMMTAHATIESAIEAMKLGATDYLQKPFEIDEFLVVVRRAIERERMRTHRDYLITERDEQFNNYGIVGRSKAIQEVVKTAKLVAQSRSTVLLNGETGTGKELVARAIWQHSERVAEPFVAINCTAIPEHLIESELFGHERGAFTGADSRRIGRFEQAHRGTLLLDEIGDLQPQVQVKLLRVLQEKAIQRVGGRESVPVDVRLIAATHRDLETMIRDGRFREDLYYRLNVMEITLPPLRDRREDIPDLVRFFLDKYTREFGLTTAPIQPEALEYLRGLPWPGNVRELENLVRKALLSSRGFPVSLDHVRQSIQSSEIPADAPERPLQAHVRARLEAAIRGEGSDVYASLLTELERELFLQTMEASAGNLAKAARWLGITRLTLREKLTRHGLRNASIPDDPPPQGPTITAA